MPVPGFEDGVYQIEGTRRNDGSFIVRLTTTRQWAREHGGETSAVIVGKGENHEMAFAAACTAFWERSGGVPPDR